MRGFMMFSQKSNETGHKEQQKILFKREMIYDFMISFCDLWPKIIYKAHFVTSLKSL